MTYRWLDLIDHAWDSFIAKVDATDPLGCWRWLGATSSGQDRPGEPKPAKYGRIRVGRDVVAVHLYVLAASGAEVTPGMSRDHGCRNRLCVNPLHIEQTTVGENSRRAWANSEYRQARQRRFVCEEAT